MLDDPRARDGVDEFVSEWLRFDRVMTASRERRIYPLFNRELAKSMTEESSASWRSGVERPQLHGGFHREYSFINSDLAAVYKTPPPGRDFQRVEFPPDRNVPGSGTGVVSDSLKQARRNGSNRPRPLHSRAVSLPAGAASTARGGYQSAPGRGIQAVTNRERLAMHAATRCARAATI
jgi:hypothetical protein